MRSFRFGNASFRKEHYNRHAGLTRKLADERARQRRADAATKEPNMDVITATLVEYFLAGLPDGLKARYEFQRAMFLPSDQKDGVLIMGYLKDRFMPLAAGHAARIKIAIFPAEVRITDSNWESKIVTIATADPNFFTIVPRTIMRFYNELGLRKNSHSLYG